MREALKIVGEIDKDDAPYFALALKIGAGIWSHDRKLTNQRKVKIFTGELLEIIKKEHSKRFLHKNIVNIRIKICEKFIAKMRGYSVEKYQYMLVSEEA